MSGLRLNDVPSWVTDHWYPNDPMGQRLAALHYLEPATTAIERRANAAFVPSGATYGCSSCGRFAFARPTTCFWCARRRREEL
jgi:hypothetical protein